MKAMGTKLPTSVTRCFVDRDLHAALFQPNSDRGGVRDCVTVMIPEATDDDFAAAMLAADAHRARVLFVCDTAHQARRAAERATAALPKHRRISIERAAQAGWALN